MEYLAIEYFCEHEDDWLDLNCVEEFDNLEDAKEFKEMSEIDGDRIVKIYEAKLIK